MAKLTVVVNMDPTGKSLVLNEYSIRHDGFWEAAEWQCVYHLKPQNPCGAFTAKSQYGGFPFSPIPFCKMHGKRNCRLAV